MRKGNMTILASILAISLVSVAFGAVTLSYFTETAIVDPIMIAGDPDIQINVNDGSGWKGWTDGPVTASTPVGWAPGDPDYTLIVRVRNVGDSGLLILSVGGTYVNGYHKLADKIEITYLSATEFDDEDYMGGPSPAQIDAVFGNDNGILTLREFVDSSYSVKFFEAWPPLLTDYLDANPADVKEVTIVFHFMEDADDDYQGLHYEFDLVLKGTDDPTVSFFP